MAHLRVHVASEGLLFVGDRHGADLIYKFLVGGLLFLKD